MRFQSQHTRGLVIMIDPRVFWRSAEVYCFPDLIKFTSNAPTVGLPPAAASAPVLSKAALGTSHLFRCSHRSAAFGNVMRDLPQSRRRLYRFPNSLKSMKRSGLSPASFPDRFGFRKPPTVAYAAFIPEGPPHYESAVSAYVGGQFWDGRAPDLASQATFPVSEPQ